MQKRFSVVCVLFGVGIIIYSLVASSGCVPTIGEVIEIGLDRIPLPKDTVSNLRPGSFVRVVLMDSTVFVGSIKSYVHLEPATYAARYKMFTESLDGTIALPNFGDSVFLTQTTTPVPYIFRGFGNGTVRLQTADLSRSLEAPLETLSKMRMESVNGTPYDMEKLWRMSLAGTALPRNVALALQVEESVLVIPLDDIVYFGEVNPTQRTAGSVWRESGLVIVGLLSAVLLLVLLVSSGK